MTMKTQQKLLGISLALVMLCGSVPLGFSDDQQSLKSQIEQGIDTSDIQCNNESHVLAVRTNDQLACVYDATAEKLNWQVIDTTQKIIYDYPMSSNDFQSTNSDENVSSSSSIGVGNVEIIISNLPKVGETAKLTVIYKNLDEVDTYDWYRKSLSTSDNLEIVSIGTQTTNLPEYIDEPLKILKPNESETIIVTVKALSEGEASIHALSMEDVVARIHMVIGERQTLLLEDYERLNPFSPSIIESDPDEIYDQDMEIDESEPTGEYSNPFEGLTEDEIREELKQMGYEGDELEIILKEILAELDPNLNSQSFFDSLFPKVFASSHTTFSLTGRITNSVSDYDTTGKTTVYGLKVCAVDKNLSGSGYAYLKNTDDVISCTNTSEQGRYVLKNIVNDDPNDNTNVDLYLYYSSNGNYVNLKNEDGKFYTAINKIGHNYSTTGTKTVNHNLSVYNQFERATWITDSMHDAREFFDDEDIRVKKVNVIWEHDEDLDDVSGNSSGCNDACYIRSTSTIWLDGTYVKNKQTIDGDEHNIWTQLHEYGHHVMREEYGVSGWGDCNNPHYIHLINTETCAWSEGWADFVPHLVTNDSEIQRSKYSWIDLEKDGYSNSDSTTDDPYRSWVQTQNGNRAGHLVEGQVASMLWDIKDNNQDTKFDKKSNTPKDNINENKNKNDDNILSAFSGNVKDITNDFYTQWNDENKRLQLTNIAELHFMKFNHAPTTISKTINVSSGGSISFILTGSDPDNDPLRFKKLENPNKGTLSPNNEFLPVNVGKIPRLTYTPDVGQTGTDSFIFKAYDGKLFGNIATITINIQEAEQTKPQIERINNIRLDEGSQKTIDVESTDINGNNTIELELLDNPDWVTITDNNDGTGKISIDMPDEVSKSSYRMKVKATDTTDRYDLESFRIYINEINTAPILSEIGDKNIKERQTLTFTASATDSDLPKQRLTFSLIDSPDGSEINSKTGVFSWTPTDRQDGRHAFTVKVSDGTLSDSEEIKVIVSGIQKSSSPKKLVVSEATYQKVVISWEAPKNGVVDEYEIFRSSSPFVSIGTVANNITTFTDNNVKSDTDYKYKVTANNEKGKSEFSSIVEIKTPQSLNNAPKINSINNIVINEVVTENIPDDIVYVRQNPFQMFMGEQPKLDLHNMPNNNGVKPITITASDKEDDPITITLQDNAPKWVGINDYKNGTAIIYFHHIPSEIAQASYTITVNASDGDKLDTETFTIDIIEHNQVPIIKLLDKGNNEIPSRSVISLNGNEPVKIIVNALDHDLPKQELNYSISHGYNATISSDGVFVWTPPNDFLDYVIFKFYVTDNGTPPKQLFDSVMFIVRE